MRNFKKLKVWQKGMELVLLVYKLADQTYELETQVTAMEMLNYGDKELRELILVGIDEEQKMLQSFITTVGN